MTKGKRTVIIIIAAIVLLLLIGGGIYCAVKYYKQIGKTGIQTTIPYGFGKDATVILLAGQSNAAGCSHDEYLKQNVSAEQYEKYENGFNNVYINHFVSGTNESHGFVKCKSRQGEMDICFGPELGLAERLNELYPERTFFIIKYTWSGTNLYDQWRAPSSDGDVGPLYNGFLEYVNVSLEYLVLRGYDVSVGAMCWMQGESDSLDESIALEYGKNLTDFISDVRTDLSAYADDDGIAFIDAYIADSPYWTYYQTLNSQKQAVADSTPLNTVIDTISHGLTITGEPSGEPDLAHYDSLSEIKLGHLFAEECAKFFDTPNGE